MVGKGPDEVGRWSARKMAQMARNDDGRARRYTTVMSRKSVHIHNNALYRGYLWLIRSKTPWGAIDHTTPSTAVRSRFRQRTFMCEGTGPSISAHTTHSVSRLIVAFDGRFFGRNKSLGPLSAAVVWLGPSVGHF